MAFAYSVCHAWPICTSGLEHVQCFKQYRRPDRPGACVSKRHDADYPESLLTRIPRFLRFPNPGDCIGCCWDSHRLKNLAGIHANQARAMLARCSKALGPSSSDLPARVCFTIGSCRGLSSLQMSQNIKGHRGCLGLQRVTLFPPRLNTLVEQILSWLTLKAVYLARQVD